MTSSLRHVNNSTKRLCANMETRTHYSLRLAWFHFILLAFLLGFVDGCSSVPPGSPGQIQQALSFTPPQGMAGVYIVRRSIVRGNSQIWEVNLDYKDVGLLRRETYFYCVVPPGRHFFCESGSFPSDPTATYMKTPFTAVAGKNYFFAFSLSRFQELAESEGQKYVRQFDLDGDNRFDVGSGRQAGESTVLLRFNVPRPAYPENFVPSTYLQVLNLETKAVSNWHVDGQGWVLGYAAPGKYLITRYTETKAALNGFQTQALDLRCQITVPRPDITVYFGTLTPANSGLQISRVIDASVRDYYEGYVPFKRSELIEGDIQAETP
jgi:hypothetical protein